MKRKCNNIPQEQHKTKELVPLRIQENKVISYIKNIDYEIIDNEIELTLQGFTKYIGQYGKLHVEYYKRNKAHFINIYTEIPEFPSMVQEVTTLYKVFPNVHKLSHYTLHKYYLLLIETEHIKPFKLQ